MKTNGQIEPREPMPTTPAKELVTDFLPLPPKNTTLNPKVALYRKLLAVMNECGYIQRDGANKFHGYRYASEAAIKAKLHASLVANRLLFLPSSEITERAGGLGKDGRDSLTTLRIQFRFIDVDTGEFESGECVGTGIDPGDKGAPKAITSAIKYILTSWFLIATGDDPEEEQKPRQEEEKPRDGSLTAEEDRELQGYRRERSQTARKPAVAAQAPAQDTPKVADMNAAFAKLREQLGERIWSEQLALSGVESITQFTSLREKREFYKMLLAIARAAA